MLIMQWEPEGDIPKDGAPPSPEPSHTPRAGKLSSDSQGIYTQKQPQNFCQLFLPHRAQLFFVNLK